LKNKYGHHSHKLTYISYAGTILASSADDDFFGGIDVGCCYILTQNLSQTYLSCSLPGTKHISSVVAFIKPAHKGYLAILFSLAIFPSITVYEHI
jgi:hypothetical protein